MTDVIVGAARNDIESLLSLLERLSIIETKNDSGFDGSYFLECECFALIRLE